MNGKRCVSKRKGFCSSIMSVIFITSSLLIGISIQVPNAEALDHDVGNLDIIWLSDYGRILHPLMWGTSFQSTNDPSTGIGFIGLVIDQSNYSHPPGSEQVADSFATWPYGGRDDLWDVKSITFVINDGVTQKSIASFQNKASGTGDPNDILIDQTAWTVVNKDWAILQWTLNNLKNAPLNNVCIGLELPLSQVGAGMGLGGDSGDDVDGFDSVNNVYWAQDNGGTGACIGFGSAIASDPLTHYYSEDYHPTTYDEYRVFWENDAWLYNRIHASNSVVGATPGNRTSTVGWNGITIAPGETRTFNLVIAANNTFANMITALKDAQSYYHSVASGFRITEFSDSSSVTSQIEVFNFGRELTDLIAEGYFLSLDGINPLPGNWIPDPNIPTYGYRVFEVTGTPIGPESDTLDLYQNSGGGNIVLIDRVSFGIKGKAPDPLSEESTARCWDDSMMEYGNDWTRAPNPSFGAKNNVPAINSMPSIVLNEAMFYPSTSQGKYITIINKDTTNSINVRDYYIVCDTAFQLSGFGDIWLEPFTTLIIKYSNAPSFFDDMDSTGDNVYLYDDNGRLLDMVGWNSRHLQGMSVRRSPDGNGTHQGYDDVTSKSAGWAFNTPLEVLMTEISDDGSTQTQIEIYNPWYPPIDFNVGFTFRSGSTGILTGTWPTPIADSGEYALFRLTLPGLNPDGDSIALYQNGVLIEEISYGQKGTVPDPLPNESVQRYWNGSVYKNVWERNYTTGPNFGAQNDVPSPNLNSKLVLNEIMFNPSAPEDAFIEIYIRYSGRNISGYKIVGDSEYIIPDGTILTQNDPFFYLTRPNNQAFFSALDRSGDNVYLYDDNGSLLDMAGWSSLHVRGETMCRIPNGNGTSDGFDDTSSIAAGWVFGCVPTVQFVKVSTMNNARPVEYGNFGEMVHFALTVTNKRSVDDNVLITNSTINGYPVIILDETGTFIITELFVPAGSSVNISVLVILPSTCPFTKWDNITIAIQSENSTLYSDSILLTAYVAPFIWPEKYASPKQIYYNGTGHDEITTITLNLTGMGAMIEMVQPQDVIFCVDTSNSMTPESIELTREGLRGYVDEMRSPDQGAVVVFNTGAWLLNRHHLTDNYTQLKEDISMIPDPGGWTYMGEALQLAIDELLGYGDRSHIQVIILLTDGYSNGALNPLDQADRAANNNITIFTIGLGPDVDEITLQEIADRTGGQYFHVDDPNELPWIYKLIAAYIGDIAGRDLDITDAVPMVRDVLPPWIILVDGSFSIAPDVNYVNETGYRILEWNISSLRIGQSWEVTFQVKSKELGMVKTNYFRDSRIYYVDYFEREFYRLFPECLVNVLPPIPLPPKLYIDILPNKDDIYLYWDEPPSPATDHYLIYAAKSPIDFDFSSPWINTSVDIDPLDPGGVAVGDRRSWNHTRAALPGESEYSEQWYYCIRTVNILGKISRTSRTVGKWTKAFSEDVSTFSLPLMPLEVMNRSVDYYLKDMNARYIKWMDPLNHIWMKHGDGGDNYTLLEVGKGYEVCLDSSGKYTFLGMPGAMTRYDNGVFVGFDYNTNAKNLQVISVNSKTGDVILTWDPVLAGMDDDDDYYVYWATTRDGFDGAEGSEYHLLDIVEYNDPTFATHSGALLLYPQLYYMVIPVNETGVEGASTYSIGVWTASYMEQYDTIGVPLVLASNETADWYCDNIPNTVGINYYNISAQWWSWHSARMPSGAYDPVLVMTEGYQISTIGSTKFTFIGY